MLSVQLRGFSPKSSVFWGFRACLSLEKESFEPVSVSKEKFASVLDVRKRRVSHLPMIQIMSDISVLNLVRNIWIGSFHGDIPMRGFAGGLIGVMQS
jgi:hypothetical protein